MSEGEAIFRIGLENGYEGRSIAWVLGHPGCFAYGTDGEAALAAAPDAIRSYVDWITAHGGADWLPPSEVAVAPDEVWQVYVIGEDYDLAEHGYTVNAWFRHDWKALSAVEVEQALKLLAWSRADLLGTVEGLNGAALHVQQPGERWDIAGILRHVGGAEWWYLDRLGLAFSRDMVPEDPFERLEKVRSHLVEVLPTLVDVMQVVGIDGEFWSPRKLLRRAVWHERDHTTHIRKLLPAG